MRSWTEGSTLASLIKRNYPISTCKFEDKDINDAIKNTEALILIDGYDECSGPGRQFVKEIIEQVLQNNKWRFIIATRPVTVDDLTQSSKAHSLLILKSLSTVKERDAFSREIFPLLKLSRSQAKNVHNN